MIPLSSDRAFTDFLDSRVPSRVMREHSNPPMRRVRDDVYDAETEHLREALQSGIYLKLKLAMRGTSFGRERTLA